MDILNEFDNVLAGIAWSLWGELGVSGIDQFHKDCLVQPEELLILTAIIAKIDPRLRDEALDWSSRYHEYISVSRLRSLLKELGTDVENSFLQFASILNVVSSAKWMNATQPVQFNVKLSGKSMLPPLGSPSLLMLRLRSLLGPGAKADLLTCFLISNGKSFSAADLVGIGYSKRSLMTALDHLVTSEILAVTNTGNRKNYELKKPRELQVITGKLPKIAPPWSKILQVIVAIRSILPEIQNSSEITRGIIFRNCLVDMEHLLPGFISPVFHYYPHFKRDWKALMEVFNGFQKGNFFRQFVVHDEFEKIVINLLYDFYPVDDCVKGIEAIDFETKSNATRHSEVYKECYQLFLSFVGDLKVRLKQFLDFPFYKTMDESLAEIPYQFSKNKLPHLLEKIGRIKSIDQITNVQLAVQQYETFMPELQVLHQFLYTFRKQLETLYFVKTNIHFDSRLTELYRIQLISDLFSAAA